MPLPKPKKDEDKQAFIDRCMGDEVAKVEFPDNDQRLGYCYSTWDAKDKKAAEPLVETRFTGFTEARVVTEDDRDKITGCVTVFDQLSDPLMFYGENVREKINPDAFDKSLADTSIAKKSYFNHNPSWILGNSENGTAFFERDSSGIHLVAIPPNTTQGKDAVILVRDGYVNHSSFAFRTIRDVWTGTPNNVVRTIEEGIFYEGGPVSDAQYPQTTANVRMLYRNLGLDFEGIREGIIKSKLQLNLEEDEKDTIKRTMDILSNALASADSGEEMGESRIDYKVSLEHLRLRLQLLGLGI